MVKYQAWDLRVKEPFERARYHLVDTNVFYVRQLGLARNLAQVSQIYSRDVKCLCQWLTIDWHDHEVV